MILVFNMFLIVILGLTFILKPSLQQLGEWKLTKFDLTEIPRGAVSMIQSTNERKTSIQCAAWCTDFDNCRAFQWKENPETLCTLFEGNGMCLNNDTNDNLMLFVDQNQTLCESNEKPVDSDPFKGGEEYELKTTSTCSVTEGRGDYISGLQKGNVDFESCKLECSKYHWCHGIIIGDNNGLCRLLTEEEEELSGWTFFNYGNWVEPNQWKNGRSSLHRCFEKKINPFEG